VSGVTPDHRPCRSALDRRPNLSADHCHHPKQPGKQRTAADSNHDQARNDNGSPAKRRSRLRNRHSQFERPVATLGRRQQGAAVERSGKRPERALNNLDHCEKAEPADGCAEQTSRGLTQTQKHQSDTDPGERRRPAETRRRQHGRNAARDRRGDDPDDQARTRREVLLNLSSSISGI
jgi:hypothetical protein